MFTEPKVGMMSDTMSPSRSLGSADMMAKQGGRHRNRYGPPLPSLTT